ncbi:MAG: TenA family protein [Bifidobacterium sp.]|uniref:TenA family protein n=2 Tax=Bifidobacterium fermentum TaxID=3059035 RepID=A0AB39ULU1_9BIFI
MAILEWHAVAFKLSSRQIASKLWRHAASKGETMSFSQSLIQQEQPLLQANEQCSFIQDVVHGRLSREAMNYYIQQDLHYTDAETYVQTQLIAKSASIADQRLFTDQLQSHLQTVNELYESLSKTLHADWSLQRKQTIQPVTSFYREHLLSQTRDGDLLDMLTPFQAGIWMYVELGRYLASTGKVKPDNGFYQWVVDVQEPTLAGPDGISARFFAVMDREAESASEVQLKRARDNFHRSCLFEWYFWDAASRQLTWNDFENQALQASTMA